jgi:hypothetical protein
MRVYLAMAATGASVLKFARAFDSGTIQPGALPPIFLA